MTKKRLNIVRMGDGEHVETATLVAIVEAINSALDRLDAVERRVTQIHREAAKVTPRR